MVVIFFLHASSAHCVDLLKGVCRCTQCLVLDPEVLREYDVTQLVLELLFKVGQAVGLFELRLGTVFGNLLKCSACMSMQLQVVAVLLSNIKLELSSSTQRLLWHLEAPLTLSVPDTAEQVLGTTLLEATCWDGLRPHLPPTPH